MRRISLTAIIAGCIVVIMIGMVVHAPLIVYIQANAPGWGLLAKAWKELVMIVATLLLIVLVSRRKAWRRLLADRVIQLGLGYIVLHLLIALVLRGEVEQIIAGLMIDLRFVAYFLLAYIFLTLAPRYTAWCVRAAVAGAIVVVGFACLQLLLPRDALVHIGYGPTTIAPYMTVDRNYEYVRFSSTLRGPNPLGAYAASTIIMLAAFVARSRRSVPFLPLVLLAGAAGTALWVSYARSGYLALIAGLAILMMVAYGHRLKRGVWLGAAVVVMVLGGLLMTAGRTNPVISNIVFHENPGEGGVIDSNGQHLQSLSDGIGYVLTHPLGAGIGRTGSASLFTTQPLIIENQYLFIAHEVGFIGLSIFLCFLGLIMKRLWRRRREWLTLGIFASGVGLVMIGMVLPVWADDTVAILWWGLAGVALATGRDDNDQSTKQKAA